MKKFICKILLFITIIVTIILGQFLYLYYKNHDNVVKINTRNIIIGDSNTRWSMDDKIIKGYSNFSTGGETYLFAETKLNILTKHNKIDTLILSFSPHNIINNMWWNDGETPLDNRMPAFYYDFSFENHLDLLKNTPKSYMLALTTIGKSKIDNMQSYKKAENHLTRFGSYLPNPENETQHPIEPYKYKKPTITNIETKYLQKIIRLCKEKKIKLILIQPPKNYLRKDYKNYDHKEFYNYYDQHLKDIDFLDFSKLELPPHAYWDMNHVDIVGAEYFSNFIYHYQGGGIKKLLESKYNRKNLHK